MKQDISRAARWMRILCAALLLSLGFAHQPMQASAPLASFDEAYRLPDGTFADICSESGHHRLPAARPFCEACLLASSILLPPPDDAAWLSRQTAFVLNIPAGPEVAFVASAVVQPKSRAPPAIA